MIRIHTMSRVRVIQGFSCVSVSVLLLTIRQSLPTHAPSHTIVISTPTTVTFFLSINTTLLKAQESHRPGAYSQLDSLAFFCFSPRGFNKKEPKNSFFPPVLLEIKLQKSIITALIPRAEILGFTTQQGAPM